MKVTIVLEDIEDDNVMVQTLADPPIEEWEDENLTGAQLMALEFIDNVLDSVVEGEMQ